MYTKAIAVRMWEEEKNREFEALAESTRRVIQAEDKDRRLLESYLADQGFSKEEISKVIQRGRDALKRRFCSLR